jgi:hypothetical protein
MRLTAMATPAMNVIEKVLTIEPACKVCGRFDDPSLAVRAAFAILDRTGFGPSSKVEVDVPSMTNLTHETKSQLVARLELLKNTISEMPETVEAEVVRED